VVRVAEWFGYELHLLVDVKHEVALAYQITDTKAGDNEALPELVRQAQGNLPAGRIRTLAYDKAADDEAVHERLHAAGIKPLIQNRALWKEAPGRPLPGGRYPLHVVHDEAGTVFCYDRASDPPVRHQMAYVGYEKDRDTLKYRCPVRHENWPCPSDQRCNGAKAYGLGLARAGRLVPLPSGQPTTRPAPPDAGATAASAAALAVALVPRAAVRLRWGPELRQPRDGGPGTAERGEVARGQQVLP
jgi:hypothetical protein